MDPLLGLDIKMKSKDLLETLTFRYLGNILLKYPINQEYIPQKLDISGVYSLNIR